MSHQLHRGRFVAWHQQRRRKLYVEAGRRHKRNGRAFIYKSGGALFRITAGDAGYMGANGDVPWQEGVRHLEPISICQSCTSAAHLNSPAPVRYIAA